MRGSAGVLRSKISQSEERVRSLVTNDCASKESILKDIKSRCRRPSRINRLEFSPALCVVDSSSSITCSNYRLPNFYKNVKYSFRLQNGKQRNTQKFARENGTVVKLCMLIEEGG